MDKKKTLVLIAALFVVILVAASLLYSRLSDYQPPEKLLAENSGTESETENTDGESENVANLTKAFDFLVYDTNGNEVRLSEYFGKPIVLNFWASWCGPCKGEMPDFHDKYLSVGKDIHFLMVNMTGGRETLDGAKKFISEKGYTFPVLFDIDMDAAETYQVYSLPTTYFINSDGYLIAHAIGAIDADALDRGIEMIKE